jgi:ribose 5-phosphate isomerase B
MMNNKPLKVYIAADHAGFHLKEKLKSWLHQQNINYEDLGNLVLNPKDDYPDFAEKLAKKVVAEKALGVLVCGSAQGMCIAANKVKGARAVVPFSLKEARLSKEHNDANILCLSGWYNSYHYATRILKTFMGTSFSKEERHVRRLNKIKKIEQKKQ